MNLLQKNKKVTIVVDKPKNVVENVTEVNKGVADNTAKGVRGLTIRRLSEPRNRSSASLHSIELEDEEAVPEKAGKEKTNYWKIVGAMNKWAATNQGILIHTAIFRLTTYQGLEIRQAIEPKKHITSFFPNDMSGFLSNSIYSYFRRKKEAVQVRRPCCVIYWGIPWEIFWRTPWFTRTTALFFYCVFFFQTVVSNGLDAKQPVEPQETFWKKMVKTLDYDLLRSGSFFIVVTGCGVVYTANTSFQMLYPLFLEVS